MTVNMNSGAGAIAYASMFKSNLEIDSKTRSYRAFFKRIIDVFLVLTAIIPLALTLLIACILVSLDGHSPFYFQKRVGRHGRIFKMWKLRSMVPNAQEILADYLRNNPAANAEWNAKQKLTNDPRITTVGKFIRKTSLDELPQLINVLLGDMSIVGPRPMMVEQRSMYPGLAYYAMRPGITGFWQVTARNESNFSERAWYDTHYFRNLSLMNDLRIMMRTFSVVLSGNGH